MSTYTVERLSFQHLTELPNAWQNADYLALLKQLDYDNPEALAPAELQEMCQMALTDLEPAAAAEAVLAYLMADELKSGQIDAAGPPDANRKAVGRKPQLTLHEGFFNATQLLHTAYNGKFPRIRRQSSLRLKSPPPTPPTWPLLDQEPAAPLLRLLAQGLTDHALLHRLF